ncbi:uncharacterized protein LOC129896606 [Solanum dulcamara]|uniref:uncharacterized protein LOC129896606 n=1 Tax=Solanum dulcamara TaxID=45834 RepID=UPI002486031C|nr:uncharacterized protein LOC129896606 [Solanum dulcamara]
MARGRRQGKGRLRKENIISFESAIGAGLKPEAKAVVTPVTTPSHETLNGNVISTSALNTTGVVKQLQLSTGVTTIRIDPGIVVVRGEEATQINEAITIPLPTTKEKEKEWQQRKAKGHMKNVWIHLKNLKPQFKKLNQTEYKAVTQRIMQARDNLANIQKQLLIQSTDNLQD